MCEGIFRSDDGKVVDDLAIIRAEVKPGSKVSVQQDGDWYVRVRLGDMTRRIARGESLPSCCAGTR
ncbi:hypothetical protein GCM10022403_061850 [Streptomyces coacervatus]|uniref:Uncharacterized protein n=1 Tax=Streptomyces coacervatus TaxID=647381 RepID=A0ABP7IJB1_9ACTN|nr:hypothetical protein [Streptomyces coacervatus]MDF2269983.1 hypothetical protein [Streptomyces coacervatus]